MQKNRKSILSTRVLNPPLITEAKEAGVIVDEISFIETEAVQSVEVQQEIKEAYLQTATVVFTSMNAVHAVSAWQNGQQPYWDIYCIGNATKQLIIENFGEHSVAGTANSAAELAELIVKESDTDEVIFFCGNQRREELPSILKNSGIGINEIVVYETIVIPNKVEKNYDGILFFSPSAVDSFFQTNTVSAQTILFAIGLTTAAAIKKYTTNQIIISSEPGKENLFRTMMEHFGE